MVENKTFPLAAELDKQFSIVPLHKSCLLYTSDAADERSSVDLGGRRIIKKKIQVNNWRKQSKTKNNDWELCSINKTI